jgi:hypothetical protein
VAVQDVTRPRAQFLPAGWQATGSGPTAEIERAAPLVAATTRRDLAQTATLLTLLSMKVADRQHVVVVGPANLGLR